MAKSEKLHTCSCRTGFQADLFPQPVVIKPENGFKYPHFFLAGIYIPSLKYIYRMEAAYKTLQTIYNISKDDSQPERYKCRPREIILRLFLDWSVIQQHLQLLESEGLVETHQEDTLVIRITSLGITKILDGENMEVEKDI